jgi:hypothetical protein
MQRKERKALIPLKTRASMGTETEGADPFEYKRGC